MDTTLSGTKRVVEQVQLLHRFPAYRPDKSKRISNIAAFGTVWRRKNRLLFRSRHLDFASRIQSPICRFPHVIHEYLDAKWRTAKREYGFGTPNRVFIGNGKPVVADGEACGPFSCCGIEPGFASNCTKSPFVKCKGFHAVGNKQIYRCHFHPLPV